MIQKAKKSDAVNPETEATREEKEAKNQYGSKTYVSTGAEQNSILNLLF